MHEFEYAEIFGFNFYEFCGSIKLRWETVSVCAGDAYAGLLLEYLLHNHRSFYDTLEYVHELPEGCCSLEDAYYKGALDVEVDHSKLLEDMLGIFTSAKIRKAEKQLATLNLLRMQRASKQSSHISYRLNLSRLASEYKKRKVTI